MHAPPSPGVTMPEGSVVISQEDIDNHNREGGAWVIIHGKVYDVQSLSTQVHTCRMVALTSVGGHYVHWGQHECPCHTVFSGCSSDLCI